jgi:hypothetical protein
MLLNGAVNLWKKDLRYVPAEIWQQVSTEVLILANNHLVEISPEIRRLQNLRTLDLGHNQIAELPDSIGDLKSLRDFLYLHDNRLASLPSSLGRLQRLRYLNISENDLSEFPECGRGHTGSRRGFGGREGRSDSVGPGVRGG